MPLSSSHYVVRVWGYLCVLKGPRTSAKEAKYSARPPGQQRCTGPIQSPPGLSSHPWVRGSSHWVVRVLWFT